MQNLKSCEGYSLEDTPFYKLCSKKRLAKILDVSTAAFYNLCSGDERYRTFLKPKKDGKSRKICDPRPALKAVQRRIADLLVRVKPPEFNYAFVRGRSYITNAAQHIKAPEIHCLDIHKYFDNCVFSKVFWFFNQKMKCERDISYILTNIVTFKACLPQGSPCSPLLAYFCYMDMWDEIEKTVKIHNCKLTVYADDIVLSGQSVPEKLVW